MSIRNGAFIICLLLMVLATSGVYGRTKKTFDPPTGPTAKLSILLLKNTNGGSQNTADGTVVLYNANYSTNIGDEDSYKFTNTDENLAINHQGTLLSIEGRPIIASADTIFLSTWKYLPSPVSYYLQLEGAGFEPNLAAVLRDSYLHTETPISLSGTTVVLFSLDANAASTAIDRFSVVYRTVSKPVSITTPPADAVSCVGSTPSFSVAADGFYLTYQWQVSADGGASFSNIANGPAYSGATTSSITVTGGVTAAMNGYLYRAVVSGESPTSAATSAAGKIIIANTWTGATSTTWNNAGNWYCAVVPAATDDVVIPGSASGMPVLAANTVINNVTLQGASTLSLANRSLIVNGIISGTGSISGSSKSDLTIHGSGVINFTTASDLLRIFTIATPSAVSLGSDLKIDSLLTISAGTLDLAGHTVTLHAGTAGEVNYANATRYPNTAMVGPVSGSISYGSGGQFLVERYIPADTRAFRFISPSLNSAATTRENWMENGSNAPGYGTHITGYQGAVNGFDPTTTNNPSLFTYDNQSQTWGDVKSATGLLSAGQPFRLFVRGDRTINLSTANPPATATILRTTGTLQTGNVTYASPFLKGTTDTTKKYNFVGNPYASPVRWSSLTKTGINTTYWAWDPNMNTRGAYVNYNYFTDGNGDFIGGFNNTGPGGSKVDNNLQPGQAFFVECSGATPQLTFHEADKSTGTTAVYRTQSGIAALSVQLLLSTDSGGSRLADGSLALIDSSFSPYVSSEDAIKFNNPDENIAIMQHDTALSIQGRPVIRAADTLFLKLWQFRQKDYYLRLEATNFTPGIAAFVKDAYLQTEIPVDLATATSLPFSLTADSASFAPDRFMIVFRPGAVLPVTVTSVKAYRKEEGIQVDWTVVAETNILRYEIEKSPDGRKFNKAAAIPAKANAGAQEGYHWFDESPAVGDNYYRIKVVERSGSSAYTKVVKVLLTPGAGAVAVYPNPVKGTRINLQFNRMAAGKYTVSLYTAAGQNVFSTQIEHLGGSSVKSIKLTNKPASGVYLLRLQLHETSIDNRIVIE